MKIALGLLMAAGLFIGIMALVSYPGSSLGASLVGATAQAPNVIELPAPSPDPATFWNVKKETSELDGKTQTTISRDAVTLRCAPLDEGFIVPNLTNLGGQLDVDLDGDGNRGQEVRYKFDDGPVQRGWWGVSTDFSALFVPRSVLRQMSRAKQITVEYKPEYVVPETAKFALDGLAGAEARAGCKM